ncbi:TlpA disulfide reductase family protein [Pseudomonas fluorescens]|uniref:TlpA disulfide reductase family protein n=1 Tax=Pseudomonas fluorescens TaxID=294 RepID=UPI0021E51955
MLLNLWATWCAPCRQEMPTLDRLQAQLGGADFQILALSVDQGGVQLVRDFYMRRWHSASGNLYRRECQRYFEPRRVRPAGHFAARPAGPRTRAQTRRGHLGQPGGRRVPAGSDCVEQGAIGGHEPGWHRHSQRLRGGDDLVPVALCAALGTRLYVLYRRPLGG